MIKLAVITVFITLGVAVLAPSIQQAAAKTPAEQIQDGVIAIDGNENGNNTPLTTKVRTGINVFLFIIGAIAVVMVVYGGFKYVVSGGDSTSVTSAKNTILYAVIGLIIALLAYAIVNFVVSSFAPKPVSNSASRGVGPTP